MYSSASLAAGALTTSGPEPSRKTTACSTASSSGRTPNSAGISGKTAAPSGTASSAGSAMPSAPRHGRDDADLVAVLHGRAQLVEVAHVLVVDEQVEEALDLAVVEQL